MYGLNTGPGLASFFGISSLTWFPGQFRVLDLILEPKIYLQAMRFVGIQNVRAFFRAKMRSKPLIPTCYWHHPIENKKMAKPSHKNSIEAMEAFFDNVAQ
jgi:hypothetical protein